MEYYTETGPRPDLAAIEVNPPEGYIGTKIMPVVPVMEKSQTIYYNDVTADAAAQTGRSTGAAPTGTQIAGTSTTFTCAEAIKRGSISPDEAKTFGGIDKADNVGAKWAKRQVMAAIEGAIRTIILGGAADATFDPAKLTLQVQTALQTVRLFEGTKTLIASTIVIKSMVMELLGDNKLGPVFARLITGSSQPTAAQGLSLEAWTRGLAIYLGLDNVLAGDDTVWNAGAAAGKFAIMKVDDGSDPLSHKWRPVFGKTFQFLPDGVNPWYVESIADRLTKNNHYDASCWYNAVDFTNNAAALYVFDGVPTT